MEIPTICIKEAPDEPETDKYTADIELSNACRDFYVSRLKAAEAVKAKLGLDENGAASTPAQPGRCKWMSSPVNKAMDTLKSEMASLIEQDLTLMKQLLTLNEQIEELKWQRRIHGNSSRYSLDGSSAILDEEGSIYSLSDVESICEEGLELPPKYPTPSSLSLYHDSQNSLSNNAETSHHDAKRHSIASLKANKDRLETTKEGLESTSDLGSSDEISNSISDLPTSPLAGYKLCRFDGIPSVKSTGESNNNEKSGPQRSTSTHSTDSGIHDPGPASYGDEVEILV